MKDRYILQALQTATIAAVTASIMPSLPIKVLGRTVPANSGKWLEIVFIPNNINGEFWDKGKTYRGLFRLLLHWPLEEEGVYLPMDVLASICSHFPIGAVFQSENVSVKIYQEPDLTGVIESAPETLYPATIRYESFQP